MKYAQDSSKSASSQYSLATSTRFQYLTARRELSRRRSSERCCRRGGRTPSSRCAPSRGTRGRACAPSSSRPSTPSSIVLDDALERLDRRHRLAQLHVRDAAEELGLDVVLAVRVDLGEEVDGLLVVPVPVLVAAEQVVELPVEVALLGVAEARDLLGLVLADALDDVRRLRELRRELGQPEQRLVELEVVRLVGDLREDARSSPGRTAGGRARSRGGTGRSACCPRHRRCRRRPRASAAAQRRSTARLSKSRLPCAASSVIWPAVTVAGLLVGADPLLASCRPWRPPFQPRPGLPCRAAHAPRRGTAAGQKLQGRYSPPGSASSFLAFGDVKIVAPSPRSRLHTRRTRAVDPRGSSVRNQKFNENQRILACGGGW